MDVELTKDAKKLLRDMCKVYSKRRSAGQSRQDAANFMDPRKWPARFSEKWDNRTSAPYFTELKHMGMIHLYTRRGFRLEDKAIIYKENRFKRITQTVVTWFRSIKDLLPH